MTKKLLLLLVVAVLLSFSLAKSQETGTIKGRVSSHDGKPLANVKIECYLDYQRVAVVSSDSQGKFVARGLIPGKYLVNASLEGYELWKGDNIHVKTGRTAILNISLKPGILVPETVVEPEIVELQSGVNKVGEIHTRGGRTGEVHMSLMDMGDGSYSLAPLPGQYPPDWNTENYASITPNIFHSPLADPLSTFSIDVDTATYSNVRRQLNQGRLPTPNTVRTEEILNYFNYDYPQPQGETPFSIYTEMGICPWNQKRNLVHIGLQGKKIDMSKAPANNLVFLLDVSGSMDHPNKLPLVKKSMELLLENLRPQDRVAIVVYAGAAGLVLPSTSGEEKAKISAAMNNLEAGGSTAGGAGIKLAYKTAVENLIPGGNNRIILCTDGDFNIGVSSNADMTKLIEENRNNGVFLTVLGFGMGNYKDDRLELLADKGNGNYAYIDDIMEAKKVLVNELGATLYTIAKDVKIQVEFNPAHVKYYRLIGYENRLLRDEDFKDDTKDAGELGAGHSVTAIYEIVPANSKEEIPVPDSLKYQTTTITEESRNSPEVMTVKLRYKLPDGDTSIPLETPVYNKTLGLKDVSHTFGFSAAAVGYAMMLQNSEHKAALTWDMVRALATENLGADTDGYRKEFLTLIDKAQTLMEKSQKIMEENRPD
ncbi:MAG: von Willebrand factor type A domain-containing protein [Candidatus Cloacimonadota bacterium]|nr:von Willebrand factor type A domain-containing protein [Candidatus Cloacimonadota bacterium]